MTRRRGLGILSSILLRSLVVLSLFIPASTAGDTKSIEEECKVCRFLVKSLREGLDRTERLHFGGGNTDWEERKLGSFRTSETRFLESMEYACRKEEIFGYDSSLKDGQFKCHAMAEEHEEVLEEWFFRRQDSHASLEAFLCVEKLKKCCDKGYYGPECQACPGLGQAGEACFGRGNCSVSEFLKFYYLGDF